MHRFAVTLLGPLLSLVTLSATTAPSTEPASQTGAFDITFTSRSPLSSHDKLKIRLAASDAEMRADYDLSQRPFVVYVPGDYSADKPVGLVVYMNATGTTTQPSSIEPLLDKRHLIFAMAKTPSLTLSQETGLSIDAVFNLKKQYNINDRRVFLMGTDWIEDVGLATPDIFAGDVWIWNTGYWKSFPTDRTHYYVPNGHPPSDHMLDLAEQRPHVFGFETDNYNDGIRSLVPGQMTKDGFQHMMTAIITSGDIGYMSPNVYLNPDWFGKMVDMLESVSLAKPKALPAADPKIAATALFNLANAYLSAGKTDLARQKLQLLIQKYPDDPHAAQARKLLDQMP